MSIDRKCYALYDGEAPAGTGNVTQLGVCGSEIFTTCCQIGDTCLEGGFCVAKALYQHRSQYYLGGCTDPAKRSSLACAGVCPQGFPDLSYNYSDGGWQCCASGDSINCMTPEGPGGSNDDMLYQNTPPLQLESTAIVKGATSFSTIFPTTAPRQSSTSSSRYTNTYQGYYTSTSSFGSSPTGASLNCPCSVSGPQTDCSACDNANGAELSRVYAVVIIVPVIVFLLLLAFGVWCLVRRHRQKREKYPWPTGMPTPPSPVPISQVVNQYVLAGGMTPQEAKHAYDEKMAAMVNVAQQEPGSVRPPAPQQTSQQVPQNAQTDRLAEASYPASTGIPLSSPTEESITRDFAQNSSPPKNTPWLPPIAEVSHFEHSAFKSSGEQPNNNSTPSPPQKTSDEGTVHEREVLSDTITAGNATLPSSDRLLRDGGGESRVSPATGNKTADARQAYSSVVETKTLQTVTAPHAEQPAEVGSESENPTRESTDLSKKHHDDLYE